MNYYNKSNIDSHNRNITRRQVVKAAAAISVLASTYPSSRVFLQWLKECEYANRADTFLKMPVQNINFVAASPQDILAELAITYNIPVSFIEASGSFCSNINVQCGTVKDVLNQLVTINQHYQWQAVMGRLIVLPQLSIYDQMVHNVKVVNTPRIDAAEKYLNHLETHIPGFKHVCGPVEMGKRDSIYTALVSLSPEATVVEHFMQILGLDRSLMFSLTKGAYELSFYFLGNIQVVPEPLTPSARFWNRIRSGIVGK